MRESRLRLCRPLLLLLLPVLAGLLSSGPIAAVGGGGPAATVATAGKQQFVIRLRPARPSAQATKEDQARITDHFEYLKGLLAEGKLILAGLALDDYAGIVVIEVEDRPEAEKIMVLDPAVRAGVFLAEVHPFRVALLAGGK